MGSPLRSTSGSGKAEIGQCFVRNCVNRYIIPISKPHFPFPSLNPLKKLHPPILDKTRPHPLPYAKPQP